MQNSVRIFRIKQQLTENDHMDLSTMGADDICFYRFVGGNFSETAELKKNLHTIRKKNALLVGVFRFPFQFEGKKRHQIAIDQYYIMKENCDSIIYLFSDGMLEVLDQNTPIEKANKIFSSFEEAPIKAIEEMIELPGEMNIDVKDVQAFFRAKQGPIFVHSITADSFDEPLKYVMNAPYLSQEYADGEQMLLNIGCTRNVDMEEFRQVNLRLHDLFHKAELFKLGTYLMNNSQARFKITIVVNGIQDPFPKNELRDNQLLGSLFQKTKWSSVVRRGQGLLPFVHNHQKTVK